MRYVSLLAAGLMLGIAAGAAYAQEGVPEGTQEGRQIPPAPMASGISGVPADAIQEWPASPQDAARSNTSRHYGGYSAIDSEGGGAIPALPLQAETQNGITYISGGIGDEEEAQLKAEGRQYDLHLLLNAADGAYISDVTLRLLDAQGKELLAVNGAGPYFFAQLPPGRYTLEATAEGSTKAVKFTIGKGISSQHIVFRESE